MFEPLEYTQKSYEKGAEEFFKFWIDSLVKQPMASTQIIIQSILGIYSKIALLEQDSSDMNISPELISLQTKRPKNTFNEQSRKTEINNLIKIIKENRKVGLLSGIGGIGKTEICKYLFHICYTTQTIKDIKYIGWITYKENLMQTFYEQILCDKDTETIENAYNDTLRYLQRLGDKLLLFVDNVDNSMVDDPRLKQLFELNCKMVITSRVQEFDSIQAINIGKIDKCWAEELFYSYFKGKKDRKNFTNIYNMTKGHPLSIELIAKTASSAGITIEEMVKKLKTTGFELPEIKNSVIFEEYNKVLIEHLNRIFSIVKLSNQYKKILYRLSLFPVETISAENLFKWKIAKCGEELELLSYRGWIYFDNDGISMHPVISDAIHSKAPSNYSIYVNMYIALRDELELYGTIKPHEKYSAMLTFNHVVSRKKFQKMEYAELINQISVIFNKMGESEQAIKLLQDSISIKKRCPNNKAALFTGYNNLALAYGRKNLKENLKYCKKAEEIGESLFKENPNEYALKYATTLNNLSLSYMNNGDLDSAELKQIKSIDLKVEYYGEDCIELAQSYNNLALVKKRKREYDEAYELHMKAISIKDAPDYPIHLYNAGEIEIIRGNINNGLKYLEQAIGIWEEDSEFYYFQLMKAYKRYLELLETFEGDKVIITNILKKMRELKKYGLDT